MRRRWLITSRREDMEPHGPLTRGIELNGADRVVTCRDLLGLLVRHQTRMREIQKHFQIGIGTGYERASRLRQNLQIEGYVSVLANGRGGPRDMVLAIVIVTLRAVHCISIFRRTGSRVVGPRAAW